MQLFKGASSHWINESRLLPGKFAWGRGYSEELQRLVERYGLEWRKDETVETVSSVSAVQAPR